MHLQKRKHSRSTKAVSPVISTVILTTTLIVTLLVALAYANNLLWTKIAESDFNSAKNFMQTVGLQIDDVAWTLGRKETVWYSTKYGDLNILSSALEYTLYVKTEESNGSYEFVNSYEVGVLLFNIPVSHYNIFDGYYELIFPSSAPSLVFAGTSAPVARVFAIEKVPMGDGSFVRVVVAPSMRLLSSTIETSSKSVQYIKLYLPVLSYESSPRLGQSVTLTGGSIALTTINHVTDINVTVSFPTGTSQLGFDASFFRFPSLCQIIEVSDGEFDDAVLELFASEVEVGLGVHD